MYKFIFILFLFSGSLAAQIVEPETTDTLQVEILPDIFEKLALVEDNGGKVEIKENAPVNELTRIHIQQNRQQKTAAGYRIQIFSGSSYDYTVERLQQMKTDFETEFPDIPVYLNYFDPDFKIRAGEFSFPSGMYSGFKAYPFQIPCLLSGKNRYPDSGSEKTFPTSNRRNGGIGRRKFVRPKPDILIFFF